MTVCSSRCSTSGREHVCHPPAPRPPLPITGHKLIYGDSIPNMSKNLSLASWEGVCEETNLDPFNLRAQGGFLCEGAMFQVAGAEGEQMPGSSMLLKIKYIDSTTKCHSLPRAVFQERGGGGRKGGTWKSESAKGMH